MPDFVDLTLDEIFGDFNTGDVVPTSKTVVDGDTARGKVIELESKYIYTRVQTST